MGREPLSKQAGTNEAVRCSMQLGQEPACGLFWQVPLLYKLSQTASGLQLDCLLYNIPKESKSGTVCHGIIIS